MNRTQTRTKKNENSHNATETTSSAKYQPVIWIPIQKLQVGDLIATKYQEVSEDVFISMKTEKVKTVVDTRPLKRACRGFHVNTTQCWSNIATIPIVDPDSQ